MANKMARDWNSQVYSGQPTKHAKTRSWWIEPQVQADRATFDQTVAAEAERMAQSTFGRTELAKLIDDLG